MRHRDAAGKTRLSYNDPAWIAQRHGVEAPPVVAALSAALAGLAKAATEG